MNEALRLQKFKTLSEFIDMTMETNRGAYSRTRNDNIFHSEPLKCNCSNRSKHTSGTRLWAQERHSHDIRRRRIPGKTMWTLSLTLLFVACLIPVIKCEDLTSKQNQNSSEISGMVGEGGSRKRPIDAGMEPLYYMTKGFLNMIQPLNKGFILEEADVLDDLSAGRYEKIISSMEDWQLWAEHYVGFVVCAAFGVLFIVVMPIAGLCFCCCRCCGNCGGKGDREERDGDRCKRGVCGILLFSFLLLILAGVICGFVTNELLREQTSQTEDQALLNKVSMELDSLEFYKINTINEFRTQVVASIQRTSRIILGDIRDSAKKAKNALGTITNSADMLEEAIRLAETVEVINETLTSVQETTRLLQTGQATLSSELISVRDDISTPLKRCSLPRCSNITKLVQFLDIKADYTKVDDISEHLLIVRQILGNNLADLVNNGKRQYDEIAVKIERDIQTELTAAEDKVEEITNSINIQVHKVTVDLEKIHLNSTKTALISIQAPVDEYGNYRYYGGMVICCIILLIVLFGLLGLFFGICGESAGEDAPACNRGVGATILMFGVGLSFLLSWIIMIIVLVTFIVGGVGYTDVCRYALDLPNAPEPIKNTINSLVSQQLTDLKWEIKLTDVIKDCRENKAIYTSLNLEQIVNISDVLNMKNYGIDEKIETLVASVNVDLSNVVIFSNDTHQELLKLQSSNLLDINFDSYKTELDKPLTTMDLTQLITDVEGIANIMEEGDVKQNLTVSVRTLRNIQTRTVTAMESHRMQLQKSIQSLNSTINGPPDINERIQTLSDALLVSQSNIQQNGTLLIRMFIEKYGRQILDHLDEETQGLSNQVQNELGRCGPVYRAVDNIVLASCSSLLNPFNGFWFSIGMCLFFFIPLIIISVVLVDLYRKNDDYYDDKSFDDVNYDAYAGVYPGDNIPLEDINLHKHVRPTVSNQQHVRPTVSDQQHDRPIVSNQQVAQHGLHNPGFQTEENPLPLPPHEFLPRNNDELPGYGVDPARHDHYSMRCPYPPNFYNVPPLVTPISPPPQYTENSRPRMY